MRYTLMFLSFILSISIHAQKEDYIWIGGYQTNQTGSGANGYMVNFNDDAKISYANPILGFLGNNASICDRNGNLLFYTNGRGVMNRSHQLMPNGDSINENLWSQKFWPKPFRGYPWSQDVMILNDPANVKGYYLFHKTTIYYPNIVDSNELRISYIDMNLDESRGDVLFKNIKYYENQNSIYFYFTAIKHQNKRNWWIVQPIRNDSVIVTFLLDETGIKRMPNQNSSVLFTSEKSSASGTSKFSPDGTKYAFYYEHDKLLIYDFDRANGTLSYKNKIITHDTSGQGIFCSVEWSPNSRFIYTATDTRLHQVDTWAADIQKSVMLIDTYNGTLDPFQTSFFLMVQAPDCKIYMAPKNGSNSIHVIKKPNELGKACDFVQNGIKLPYPNGGELPNFPRFRVDEVDKCDPTITSVFGENVYYRRDLNVYPNPSQGVFRVEIPEGFKKGTIVITNIHGHILMQEDVVRGNIDSEINITSYPNGIYNIEVYPIDNKERIFYGRRVVKI